MSSLNNKFTAKLTTVAPPIKEYKIGIYQDSYILNNNPRTNYGDYNAAQISNSKTNNAASMIEFSGLKDIPAKVLNNLIDAQVSITYSMTLRHDYSLNVYDYNVGGEWSELTIYWENAPVKGDKLYTMTLAKGATSSNIDVTDLLKSQVSKEANTIGLYLDSDDTDVNNPLCMYTKEHYNKRYRPVLTLRYFDVPGVPMTAHINGDITVKREVSHDDGNTMDINGEVSVGMYSVKKDLECKGDDKLIVPKFTVFDMAVTNTNDETLGYEAGYDAISNADDITAIQELFENDEVSESASTGDMITGEVTVMTAGGNAFINGTLNVPKLFIFTTLFLDKSDTVLFSFPADTNIADAKILMPYDKTEVDGGEISGDVSVRGFGGHHYINSVNFAVSNPVEGIEDITGTVEVAVPRFSNYDTENEEWVDFEENNIITGTISITPVVRAEIECTGKNKLKVPKLFVFNTYLKRPDENEELETVYTFPKGEDIDDYSYTEDPNNPITNTEQDGGEITGTVDSIGRKTAEINGSNLTVVLEVPSTDIECEPWDIIDGIGYEDADFYILGKYEDKNDNNIISCEKSNVDHTNYTDANLYIKAMISVPTYYDKGGHILPDNPDEKDVYRVEFTAGTIINGTVGVPHEDPITKDINGELKVALPVHKEYDVDNEEWVDIDVNNNITCEKSDVDHEHYEEANFYVEARVSKVLIGGPLTVKREENKYINGTFTVGKNVDDIDDITCEKSDVDHEHYEDADLYIKGLVYNGLKDNCATEINGSVQPMFGVHEDINGTITVYAKINNGGWIDCDITEVDGDKVKFTDANFYVVKSVEDYINGDVSVRGAITAYINSDNFEVSVKLGYAWINCGINGLTVSKKADEAWINGTVEVREMVTDTIEGTVTVEKADSEDGSYAYIF